MRIKPVTYLLILLFSCLVLQGFPTGKYKIGFSQCTTSDHWRQTQLRLMEMELSFYPDMELQVKDAGDNNELQIRQINEFLAEGIDLLIVSPNESEPVTPVVEKVFNQGIPVIVIDRTINTDRYTAYIGGNNYEIGLEAGRYAAALLKGKGDILEIKGLSGSSPAIARHAGFLKSLESYPNIRIVKSVDGEWNWNIARQVMTNLVNSRLNYDLIFAHNDVMALEAYKVLRESGSPLHPYILGIDGLPGDDGGIQYVLDGRLDATFLYPTGGEKAIQTAHQILTGLPYKKQNIMSTMVIDSTNARILKMQTDETELLQQKIEKQRSILATQLLKNKTQRSALISLIALLAVTAAFIVVIFQALRTRKRANRALEQKNQEIEKQKEAIITQRDQLVEVSRQLEEATQAKLRFYTNISHEFRTPLTLIKGPLENLMESEEFSPAHRNQFSLMHRNTVRLLRLVNQLMDFRKLENQKMELAASENDLLAFLGDIRESFSSLAGKRNIDLQVISGEKEIKIWFDRDKMDKVFFNILSNAFKFTSDGGEITVFVTLPEVKEREAPAEEVLIEIRDTGTGIPARHLDKIFDRFYQAEKSQAFRGTGLGLNLSREFVEMHHGQLTASSHEGEGTSFFIRLPLGTRHLQPDELVQGTVNSMDFKDNQILTEDLAADLPLPSGEFPGEKKPVILIVEDEPDIREFIRQSLGDSYQIIEAGDGREGLTSALEEEPDLIISDVMMPEMNGLELTRAIKTDQRTCHLPVILLTARAALEHKLEGLEEGADSYIPKPFNSRHLQIRVRKLLENRAKIREHYKLSTDLKEEISGISRLDKKFLSSLVQMVEENLGDENLSVDEMGTKLGISRVHLYRKIKKLTGLSVSEFVTSVKLKKSTELLLNSGKSISEIAYEVGFTSPSYFSRCFREYFKMAPSEYLLRIKNREPR